jgi:hypothetical protein
MMAALSYKNTQQTYAFKLYVLQLNTANINFETCSDGG